MRDITTYEAGRAYDYAVRRPAYPSEVLTMDVVRSAIEEIEAAGLAVGELHIGHLGLVDLAKEMGWPEREAQGLLARALRCFIVVTPDWKRVSVHGVTRADVRCEVCDRALSLAGGRVENVGETVLSARCDGCITAARLKPISDRLGQTR